ncbi:hypothetical protein C8R46DRAFT_1059954 [Mycena filopes]|nr:hypothetical protein C8R46DRAFT_1059954 [Mycena filopes]
MPVSGWSIAQRRVVVCRGTRIVCWRRRRVEIIVVIIIMIVLWRKGHGHAEGEGVEGRGSARPGVVDVESGEEWDDAERRHHSLGGARLGHERGLFALQPPPPFPRLLCLHVRSGPTRKASVLRIMVVGLIVIEVIFPLALLGVGAGLRARVHGWVSLCVIQRRVWLRRVVVVIINKVPSDGVLVLVVGDVDRRVP